MKIQQTSTLPGALVRSFWVFVVMVAFAYVIDDNNGTTNVVQLAAAGLSAGYFLLSIAGCWLGYARLRKRDRLFKQFADSQGLEVHRTGFDIKQKFLFMTLGRMRDMHRDAYRNMIDSPEGWAYADYSYTIRRRGWPTSYDAAREHYAVMTVLLPRKLPNIFFDSRKVRGRQFRFHFFKNQLHHLEGDFDRYFATYFPEDYTIDSMSFISPEVLWALREAREYDAEIIDDRLFLYGDVKDPAFQLSDMHSKIMNIKKHLEKNVRTYRDARLPVADGRKRVSRVAVWLKPSYFWEYVMVAAAVVYVVFELARRRF